jgi:hypothetical protein
MMLLTAHPFYDGMIQFSDCYSFSVLIIEELFSCQVKFSSISCSKQNAFSCQLVIYYSYSNEGPQEK